jgi:hypothetical protein
VDVSIARPGAAEREGYERDRHRDLIWLASVLWPEADVRLSPTRVPPGQRVAEAYAVIPNAARPRLLVPFSSPALAEPAMRRYDDGMSALDRAGRSVGSMFATSTLGWSRFPPLVVFFDRDPRPDELLTQYLRAMFDRPDATLAISFGPPGPNRKPVVQVLALEGDALGFAKVGWNAPTRRLVANELATLRRWTRERPDGFRVPAPIDEGRWQEHLVTVAAALPATGRRGRRTGLPPVEVTREIARSGGLGLSPLSSTPWWRSILRRGGSARDATGVVLRWMQDLHGRRLMWHGSWHGDWTPRNMATIDGALHVWGWERFGDGVPLGLDPIHFEFQTSLGRRRDVARAAGRARRRCEPTLRALGVPREDDALLMACYLAELLVRSDEGRRHGAPAPSGMPEALLAELRRWVGSA